MTSFPIMGGCHCGTVRYTQRAPAFGSASSGSAGHLAQSSSPTILLRHAIVSEFGFATKPAVSGWRCFPSLQNKALRVLNITLALLVIANGTALPQESALDELAKRTEMLRDELKYSEALAVSEQLIEQTRASAGEESVRYAAALSRKASVLYVQGAMPLAAPLFEQSLAIYDKVLPADHPDRATALNNVGMQRVWMGRFAEAPRYLREALEIREKLPDHPDLPVIESLSNLGFAYIYLDRSDEAITLCERAVKLAESSATADDLRIGYAYQNLASARANIDDYEGAVAPLQKAMSIYAKSLPEAHPTAIGAITRLAVLLFQRERFNEAEGQFREALRRLDRVPITLTTPATLTDFGINQIELGKYDEAEELLRRALSLRETLLGPKNPEVARTLGNLAEVEYRRGRFEAALDLVRQTTEILASRDKLSNFARLNYVRHTNVAWALFSRTEPPNRRKLLAEGFSAAQRAAETETAGTVSRMGARLAARDPRLRDLVRELDDLGNREKALEPRFLGSLGLSPAERDKLFAGQREALAKIETRRTEVREEIAKSFPDYAELVAPKPMDLDTLESLLAEDEALLFLLPTSGCTYIWVASKDGTEWVRSTVTEHDIRLWVLELRKQIDADIPLLEALAEEKRTGQPQKRPPLFDLGFSNDLYAKLFAGVDGTVRKKKHLLIVPYGRLDSLPFQVLVASKPKIRRPRGEQLLEYENADWLIRSHALSVLPSVASLKTLRVAREQRSTKRPVVAFANPAFGVTTRKLADRRAIQNSAEKALLDENGRLDLNRLKSPPRPLPETETEVRTVLAALRAPSDAIFVQADATEARVKSMRLDAYKVVYFATHGLMAGEIPGLAEPALLLSIPPKPSEEDDALLTASEIAELKLDADWVILSACNTAAGESQGGEALSGLARAFFHAGARSLLVSHWSVDSEAATDMAIAAFKALGADPSMRRSEALRRAMLVKIADNGGPPSSGLPAHWNAYPSVWAPFVLVGDGNR